MKNIDDYIIAAKNMPNTSDGGSAAYHFDDGVVLIRYTNSIGYDARKNEELIAEEANKKRAKGVNTPAHLAIKRVSTDKINICWVLQERAKGECFSKYNVNNNDPQTQIQRQMILLNAPDSHYEKCIMDLCELLNMGLELKPKNIFYDKSRDNGGFTFIDLLENNSKPLNPNSLSDVMMLYKYIVIIISCTYLNEYTKASEEEKKVSQEIYYKVYQKMFSAMEKVIPNFSQFRRWILRAIPKDILNSFENNGTYVGNLSLTEEEYNQFDIFIKEIIDESMEKLSSGKKNFGQIKVNEIRNALNLRELKKSWLYHRDNKLVREDFDDEYDYVSTSGCLLEEIVNDIFDKRLEKIAQDSTNPNILEAKQELDKIASANIKK